MVSMKGSSANHSGAGRLMHGPESHDELPRRTIEFIREQLPTWRDDRTRPPEVSEKRLNPHLVLFLNARARHDFAMATFLHEAPEGGRHSVDVGVHSTEAVTVGTRVYSIYEPFLAIECKRLPGPSRDREREYLSGHEKRNGGIQRFKLGLHGKELEIAVMIGYVQDGELRDWHKKVNGWITELIGTNADGCSWTEVDRLGNLSHDKKMVMVECESVHRRINALTDSIRLQHFWLKMTTDE
jgi:hypothetical protein